MTTSIYLVSAAIRLEHHMQGFIGNTGLFLGLFLFVMGAIGFTMCVIEIREILRLNNIFLFKYFNLSHAIIHATAQLVVVIIGGWVPPHLIGYTALALQFSSLYTSITMSLNRMMSVRFPFIYAKVFTKSNTIMIIIVTWLLAFSSSIVLLIGESLLKR
ncbi:hypothetical protein ANCCAN_12156 [Ancylostoma caninum]|uniref:G-protein coupled receptors family 1 profile domain-containing protein n=1 Tax=Ancylostoma caninum TaxID=29170 RepID=A0A368GBW0_ANCCA|nr:hypothetical protein ANCCAN_12156 [Ancylostoma caninum]